MNKILIISYHSLPFDVIASYRANAYLKHFKKFGMEPTLLTHFVGGKQEEKVVVEKYDYGNVIRIPIKKKIIGQCFITLERLPLINKLSILLRWLLGYLDARPEEINSYLSLKEYCIKHINKNEYDVAIGIFSPHHHLRLCHLLYYKLDLPYVLDFRDLWQNRVIHEDYRPNWIEKTQDILTINYWKKWLSNASFFTITSEPWKKKMQEFTVTKGHVINNGFEHEVFEKISLSGSRDEFIVLYSGSLYAHQKLNIFLDGCNQFISAMHPKGFKVKFVGADRRGGVKGQLSGFMYEPKAAILNKLSSVYCEVTGRIPKEELIQIYHQASVLLLLSWPYSPGTYSGKVFDYLGVRKPILVVPDDNSVIGELIRETNAGEIKNTPQEVCEYLNLSYNEWISTKMLRYKGNQKKVDAYSRENQVKKMVGYLSEVETLQAKNGNRLS